MGLGKRCGWIAGYHGQRKNGEERGIGKGGIMFLYELVILFYLDIANIIDPNHLFDMGIFFYQRRSKGLGRGGGDEWGTIKKYVRIQPEDTVGIGQVSVITKL